MAGYGWEEYDVRTGGKQVIYDKHNKVDISTEFVKVEGGYNGIKISKFIFCVLKI
jgi:mannosyl-oligosaccharide glucosidase